MRTLGLVCVAALVLCCTERYAGAEPSSNAGEASADTGVVQAAENVKKEVSLKVALAYEETRFKKLLIDELQRLLVKKGVEVVVVEHSEKGLNIPDPSIYGAVFISNSGVRSKVRPWILQWLAKNKDYGDKVLLHVTQRRNWSVDAGVDAVTSASKKSDVKALAADYAAKIIAKAKR